MVGVGYWDCGVPRGLTTPGRVTEGARDGPKKKQVPPAARRDDKSRGGGGLLAPEAHISESRYGAPGVRVMRSNTGVSPLRGGR